MKVQNPDAAGEIIIVVDGQDNVLEHVPRSKMRQLDLLHRVTYLLIFNASGQLLVQTRTDQKDWYPGYLDFAAGGVVQAGESYFLSAQRELQEELGISEQIRPCFKMYFEESGADKYIGSWGRSWGVVYSCICEGPFQLQAEEVASAEFIDIEKVLAIDPSMVTPDTRQAFLAYLLSC